MVAGVDGCLASNDISILFFSCNLLLATGIGGGGGIESRIEIFFVGIPFSSASSLGRLRSRFAVSVGDVGLDMKPMPFRMVSSACMCCIDCVDCWCDCCWCPSCCQPQEYELKTSARGFDFALPSVAAVLLPTSNDIGCLSSFFSRYSSLLSASSLSGPFLFNSC